MNWEIYAKGLARIRVEGGYIYAVINAHGDITLNTSLLFVPDKTTEEAKTDE